MKDSKISALLIVFNEEKNIEEALKTVEFADEIIVLDSFSTDSTVEIIKTKFPKVQLYQNRFEDFTKQRNLCISYAKNEWILFLDADERITPELKNDILKEIKKPITQKAYFFKRKFFFKGEKVNYSGTQNDKNIRLFKREVAHYDEHKRVHEGLDTVENPGVLEHYLLHYSFDSYESYHDKVIHYSKLKAKDLYEKKIKYRLIKQLSKSIFNFFKMYILKLGILDGRKGITLSYLSALSSFKTYEFLKKEYA
ncbi:glycosyltransferase family 2 protein [Chryseobacterium sp. RR2-3-20]|uniref:glycosyltransferase family 2 protein n=1 Tax=Chryseobacterium sp. RR2-3-20 TaxID=2787626 RepID=UPI001AE07E00|nr:glycosyltransferase family 2 protein [Chryseobacterium sp. RR2-3-20]